MAGIENWETCVCFCFSYFLVAVTKQVPGVGYMAAHLQQKKSFLESTLALRTPRYNGHTGNTDNS